MTEMIGENLLNQSTTVRTPMVSFLLWGIRVILQLNGTFCQELVPYDFPLVVLHKISIIAFHLWCMLGGSVWIWMKSNLFRFIEGQTHFSTSWHAKLSLTLNWTNIGCSSFKPPHYLQACTKNLPNMEGVVCKQGISDQKPSWVRG